MNINKKSNMAKWILSILTTVLVGCTASVVETAPGSSVPADSQGLSGVYCMGNNAEVREAGGNYTMYIPELGETAVVMTAAQNGQIITLSGQKDAGAFGVYDLQLIMGFTPDMQVFSSTLLLSQGGMPLKGLHYMGTRGACAIMDVNNLPKFITASPINLSKVAKISRFRSSAGHSYTDASEQCLSKKHYFEPINNGDRYMEVYTPFSGTVVSIQDSDGIFADDEMTNQHIVIRSSLYPGLVVNLFHIELTQSLRMGDTVTAGQQLGWADLSRNGGVASDIDVAVHVMTSNGSRNVSLMDVLTDDIFAEYTAWSGVLNLINRSDFQISKADRDANPMVCAPSPFTSSAEFVDREADALSNLRWISN